MKRHKRRAAERPPKSTEELLAEMRAVEADPKSWNPPGLLYVYTAAARKKLDAIARAIADNRAEQRNAEGNPVPCAGYSGRQSNRR